MWIERYDSMKSFTILGERCSGNHFLKFSILNNFHISYSDIPGSGHFFSLSSLFPSDVLVFCIIRQREPWIDSFFKRLHHIPFLNKLSLYSFISNPFYSVFDDISLTITDSPSINETENLSDRHLYFDRRYHNIFELRETKLRYMLEELPKVVLSENLCIIKYEDLRDKYQETMEKIQRVLQLTPKQIPFATIPKYKGTYNELFSIKPILISKKISKIIKENSNEFDQLLYGD